MASSHPPSCYDDAAGDGNDVDFSQEEGPKAPARPANQKEACTFIIVVHASILLLVQLPIRRLPHLTIQQPTLAHRTPQ